MQFLEVELEVYTTATIPYRGRTKELFDKWQETGLDEDFEEFAEWASEDVKDEIEFWIEDAKVY